MKVCTVYDLGACYFKFRNAQAQIEADISKNILLIMNSIGDVIRYNQKLQGPATVSTGGCDKKK